MVSSSMNTSIQTVKACASARNMMETIHRSFDSLFIAAISKVYAFPVFPRLECGRPAIFLCNTTEMSVLERTTACRRAL